MSDTPRTDKMLFTVDVCDGEDVVAIWFARNLERELNAANVELEEKRKDIVWLATEKAKSENYVTELENRLRALWDKYDGERQHYMDRIKRLEEAGDEMEQWTSEYGPIYRWRKAKENKQ